MEQTARTNERPRLVRLSPVPRTHQDRRKDYEGENEMNAIEAKNLSINAGINAAAAFEQHWKTAREVIDRYVETSAKQGKLTTKINLKTVEMDGLNKHLDEARLRLEKDGFKVEFLLTRTPNGAREMILSW
jgi:hypothetical protein